MKLFILFKLMLISCALLLTSVTIFGQSVSGFSDLVYDQKTKTLYGISRTRLDYEAGLYYEPAVIGTMFREKEPVSILKSDRIRGDLTATVVLSSGAETFFDTQYDLLSDHFAAAYFRIERPPFNDHTEAGDTQNELPKVWFLDQLGFNSYGGGQEVGWYRFRGKKILASLIDYRYFNLVSTGRGFVTDAQGNRNLNASEAR